MRKLFAIALSLACGIALAAPVRSDIGSGKMEFNLFDNTIVPIEYLESTGTQWIDTGILASTDVRPMTIGFRGFANLTRNYLFGGGDSADEGFGFYSYRDREDSVTAGLGWTKNLTYWTYDHTFPCDTIGLELSSQKFKLNGRGGNTISFSATYSYTFALFGRNIGGEVSPCAVRIYFAQIGDLDMVPVRFLNVDGEWEGGMLDLVSGSLFGNSGTGEFLIGPDL